MSTVAVKIMRNIAASPPPYEWMETDFYDYEIIETPVHAGEMSIIKKLGGGNYKIIERSGCGIIPLTFQLLSTNADFTSTLEKLKVLKNYNCTTNRLILYPSYISEPDFYKIVVMPKDQIPDKLFIAGRHSGLNSLTVNFYEIEKTGSAVEI